jgi:hypothetical protein
MNRARQNTFHERRGVWCEGRTIERGGEESRATPVVAAVAQACSVSVFVEVG